MRLQSTDMQYDTTEQGRCGYGASRPTCRELILLTPGLCLVKKLKEGSLCCSSLVFLPLFAAGLFLSHVPAEVVKDLAPLLGLLNGLVAGIAHQLGQLALPS